MYKNKRYRIAVEISRNEKYLLSYDIDDAGNAIDETEGKLVEISSPMYEEISNHFDINMSEYGVEITKDND